MAVLLVASAGAAGFAMAAAPSVDNETSETTQDTDITDGGSQAYNATSSSNFSWSADSNSSKIVIEQGNTTLYTATPEEYHHNSTSGTSYFNVSLADDGSDYSGLEADANENVTLDVTIINNTEADSPDKTNVSFTFANNDTEAFGQVTTDDTEVAADGGWLSSLGIGSEDGATGEIDVGGNENTETINVHIANDDLSTALSDTIDAADDDTPAYLGSASVAGQTVFVFSDEAEIPDWVSDDDYTYVTVSSDGSTLTIHNAADQFDDEEVDDVEISATGNEAMGFWTAQSTLTDYYELGYSSATSKAWNAQDWNGEPDWEDAE